MSATRMMAARKVCKTGLVRSRPHGVGTRLRESAAMFKTNFVDVFLANRPELHRPTDPVFSK